MAFPSSVVAQLQSLGGKPGLQRLDLPFFLAGATISVPLVPTNPFEGAILHHVSFPSIVPDAFAFRLVQRDLSDSTYILEDMGGVEVLAYIDAHAPLYIRIQSRSNFDGFLVLYLHSVSFAKRQDMLKARALLETR